MCPPTGVAVMLLLIPCLLLLVQANAQQSENKNHGGVASPEHRTSFSCVGRVAGYYADIESGCQMYHLCDGDGRRFTQSCPNATLFQQRMMICDHWYMVNCNKSESDYSANLLIGQRDKLFVGNDHNHHREPVNFFSVSQNPGTLQQPNWFPLAGDRPEKTEDTKSIVPSPLPTIPAVHIAYTPQSLMEDVPPSQRQARNRNLNSQHSTPARLPSTSFVPPPSPTNIKYSDRSSVSGRTTPQSSYANTRYSDRSSVNLQTSFLPTNSNYLHTGTLSNVTPQKISVSPQYPQTKIPTAIPQTYANNPFFQSLLKNNLNSSSYTPIISNSRIHFNPPTPQYSTTVKPKNSSNITFSQTQPQQSLLRRTKEFSVHVDNSDVQNLPPLLRNNKLPDPYTNNPYAVSSAKTRTSATQVLTTSKSNNFHEAHEIDDDLNNVVELHLLDPRKMFYIPESRTHELDRGNSTVLFISVPSPTDNGKHNSRGVMHFRRNNRVEEGYNPQCPKCHPRFLKPGTCHPCVIIR